jgi:hypothetical protein
MTAPREQGRAEIPCEACEKHNVKNPPFAQWRKDYYPGCDCCCPEPCPVLDAFHHAKIAELQEEVAERDAWFELYARRTLPGRGYYPKARAEAKGKG